MLKEQIWEHEERLNVHDERLDIHDIEFANVNERIDRNIFIKYEIVFNKPGQPVKEYIEPEGILSDIDKKLSIVCPLLICSPGGIGKSELCRKYYADRKQKNEFIWFDFIDSIETTLLSVADQRKLGDPVIRAIELNRVIDRLKALDKSAVVIIDNVLSLKAQDVDMLSNLGCRVILTSREKFEAQSGNLEKIGDGLSLCSAMPGSI